MRLKAPVATIVTADEMGRASSAAADPLRSAVMRSGTPDASTWPFGLVEAVWAVVAANRWRLRRLRA